MALRYYLTIDGVAGASSSDAHEGAFDVNAYSFDVSAIIAAMRGTGGGGHTGFSPLTIDLDANSGMASLLNLAATGRHIPSLELQGVSSDGQTLYDLRLGDVVLTRVHDDSTGHDVLQFSYGQVSVTTTEQEADGRLAEPVTFSWDVDQNRADVNIPQPHVPAGGPTAGEVQNFFLTIDGIAGDSVRDGHEGAFDVNGYSFDVSAIVAAMRGSGGGSGRTEFSPLTVDLDANPGMASLLQLAATGRHIPSLELQGVSPDGQTVYDLRLGDVVLTRVHDDSTGHDVLQFSYGQVSVTTTGQEADGRLSEPVTFSWDVAANRPDVDIPDPRVPAGGSGGDAQNYFLTIDGIAGDSVRDGHEGAFDVNGYSFDVSAIVAAMRGSGGGSGRTEFSPLTVDLDANPGMASLLEYAATGRHIPSLELEGVSTDGQTVYDLRLGDVVLTRVHDDSTGHDVLQFSYGQVSVTTTGQEADGRLSEPVTFSWDVAANRPGVDIPDPRVPAGGSAGGDAQNYFLTIDGIAGDSVRDDHEGAFDVNGYSFDVSAIVAAMRGSGGGSGRTEFSPLTVDLDANPGMASLLEYAATGRHIPSLELEGVSTDGQTVYDLRLGDVVLTRVHDDSTGHDVLQFSYGQVSVTTTGQEADGRLSEPVTFSWDVAANRPDVDIPPPHVPAGGSAGGDAQNYYLTIDGIAGGSVRDGHEGAFDVNGYSFDVSAIVAATRGGGAGSGHTEFSPLTVDLNANPGMVSLLEYAATGRHIPSLELQGVSPDGQTVYDLRLGDVVLTRVHDDSTGHDVLQFSYGQVSVTTTGQEADGRLAEPVTFSWDVNQNRPDVNIPQPHVPAGGATGGEAQNYYLTIDGVAGDSVRDGHEGAFDVNGYSFDVSAIVAATRGGGGGSGHTEFSPLTIDLDASPGMASLLELAATGRHIPSLELQGVSPDGQTVYDLRLGDVVLTRVHDDSTGHDVLQFSYGQVSVTTTGQEADGRLAEPVTFSWDVAANRPDVDIADPRLPADFDQHLNGNEAEILIGRPGGILTGADLGQDQFVFTGDFGRNEVTNFGPEDQIVLERSHFGNVSDILEHHASDDGHGNTVITDPVNPHNVIVLDDVHVSELDPLDFVLL